MSKQFTAEQVAEHTTRDDIWIIYNEKVYDVSAYLDEHPGGEEVILDCAGQDATEAFDDIGHSEDAIEILQTLYIGDLIGGVKNKNSKIASGETKDSNVVLIAAGLVAVVAVAYFALK
jgi:cytochrome b involved in lipid metabolism